MGKQGDFAHTIGTTYISLQEGQSMLLASVCMYSYENVLRKTHVCLQETPQPTKPFSAKLMQTD